MLRELPGTALAFLVRDFQTEMSYRVAFLLQFFGLFVRSLLWFMMARLVGSGSVDITEATGGVEYFDFVLMGLAVQGFLDVSLSAYANQIRLEQTTGTLEAMLVTPASLGNIVFASATWSYVFATLNACIYVGLGVALFGVELDVGNLLGVLLAILFTVVAISGIGILSASFVLYFKRGNPFTMLVGTASFLFGGIVIPPKVLPEQVSWISAWVPTWYAGEAVRDVMLQGAGVTEILPHLARLALFAVVLVPIGLAGARFAVRRAKRDGTLVQY